MMAGASAAMMTSALLQNGIDYVATFSRIWCAGWRTMSTNRSAKCEAA